MSVLEILEPLMSLMDSYPLTSIAFCLLLVLGMVVYKVVSHLGENSKKGNHYPTS